MKRYILIAGVNGSGKSTLYRLRDEWQNIPRVNTDEILKEFGDWRNTTDLIKAGKIAVRKLQEYLSMGVTFNQETTLCGKSVLSTIKKAKPLGYIIELHYVGVNSVEIAKERVSYRVLNGGHGIPSDDIERRYFETFENLKQVLPMCNLAALYDNSEKFRRFAIYKNGELVRLSSQKPEWFERLF